MSWKLELLRAITKTAKVGLSAGLGSPNPARKRVRRAGCTPCEVMAQVQAAKDKVKTIRASGV